MITISIFGFTNCCTYVSLIFPCKYAYVCLYRCYPETESWVRFFTLDVWFSMFCGDIFKRKRDFIFKESKTPVMFVEVWHASGSSQTMYLGALAFEGSVKSSCSPFSEIIVYTMHPIMKLPAQIERICCICVNVPVWHEMINKKSGAAFINMDWL